MGDTLTPTLSRGERGRIFPWLGPGLIVGALLPLVDLVWRVAAGSLVADAIAISLNKLGILALALFWASLACTPLKTVFGWTWPARIRRELGLLAFLYMALHVLTYAAIDQGLDLHAILADVLKRRFTLAGFLAFALLVPVAWTSFKDSPRKLGFKRWQAIHRLVYPAACLAAIHFVWRVKKDLREPLVYATVLAALFAVRLFAAARRKARRATPR